MLPFHIHVGTSSGTALSQRHPAKGLCAPCMTRGCLRVAKRRVIVPPSASAVADAVPSVESKQEAIRKKMQWFRVPPKVYFKGGCLEVAMAELAGKKRAMIITDQKVYDLELTEKVVDCLDANNIQNQVFTHVPSAPTESTIRDGLREINDMRPDVIIAIAGGSPMDAAKVMWLLYEVPTLNLKKLIEDSGMGRSRMDGAHASMGNKALCICIPTTSGTGAEVTPFAVIKDETTGRNVTLANYALTPSMAIVDPQLVMNLPAKQTAYGGQLTLAHAMESYISIFSSEYTHAEAKHAMSMMSRYYERAYRKGNMDYHAREKMHNAATVAGMAFANTYLGVCHALATEVAITTGCHVGLASGVILPYVLAFMATNNKATKGALADLSDHLHVGGTTLEERYTNVMDWVKSMQAAADIPTTLTSALDAQACAALTHKLDAVCEAALANAHVVAAPVTPTLADLKAILKAAGI